jgi:hypothetical protein
MKLSGYKTHICAAVGVVVTLLYLVGVVDAPMWEAVLALAGFGGLSALRDGVRKL